MLLLEVFMKCKMPCVAAIGLVVWEVAVFLGLKRKHIPRMAHSFRVKGCVFALLGTSRAIDIDTSKRITVGMTSWEVHTNSRKGGALRYRHTAKKMEGEKEVVLDSAEPERVIIDTDPGVDDTLALFLALAHPGRVHVVSCSIPEHIIQQHRGLKQ